jgi:hypothetical protein
MKPFVLLTAVGLLSMIACNKPDSGASSTSSSGATNPMPSVPATTAAALATTAAPAKAAFVQKGVPAGKVVVGYIQDGTDPSQCAAVVDVPAKKDDFTKNADKIAQMMKGKVVAACPTENIVGTCNAGMGMLANYSGPKWTAETAKKDCLAHPYQKWVE